VFNNLFHPHARIYLFQKPRLLPRGLERACNLKQYPERDN
jgi:hypothetical protein